MKTLKFENSESVPSHKFTDHWYVNFEEIAAFYVCAEFRPAHFVDMYNNEGKHYHAMSYEIKYAMREGFNIWDRNWITFGIMDFCFPLSEVEERTTKETLEAKAKVRAAKDFLSSGVNENIGRINDRIFRRFISSDRNLLQLKFQRFFCGEDTKPGDLIGEYRID